MILWIFCLVLYSSSNINYKTKTEFVLAIWTHTLVFCKNLAQIYKLLINIEIWSISMFSIFLMFDWLYFGDKWKIQAYW